MVGRLPLVSLVVLGLLTGPAAGAGEGEDDPLRQRHGSAGEAPVPSSSTDERADEQVSASRRRFEEEIVVTATRSERAAADLPLSVSLIAREDVERSPALALDDLLRSTPGLNLPVDSSVVQYPSRNTFSMRGLGGVNRTLVLLDGIPLNDPMFGHVNWNDVQLGSVERVEVVRGGAGSLYGGLAMGGTVHVISRPPLDGALSTELSFGSHDTRGGALSVARRVAPRVVLGFDVEAAESAGFHRVPAELRQPIDTPSEWDRFSGRLQASLEISDTARGFVRATFLDSTLSLGTPFSEARRESSGLATGFELETVLGGDLDLHLYWLDQSFDNDNIRILGGGTHGFLANSTHGPSEILGASAQWSRELGPRIPLVGLGFDVRRATSRSDRRNFDAAGQVVSSEEAGGEQLSSGLFAQASWALTPRFEVLAGVRADSWRNHSGSRRASGSAEVIYPSRSLVEVSPRLAARYDLGDGVGLRAAAYGAFGPPTLRDLYRSSAFRGQENRPNPELGPERLTGGELGLDVDKGRVRVQLNLFHNEIEDVITEVTLQTEPVFVLQPQNVGTGRSRGAELFGEAFLDEHWSLSASYAAIDATTIRSPLRPDLVGRRFADVPEDTVTAGATFRATGGGSVTARAVYTSAMFADAENRLSYDARTLVDLFATWPLRASVEVYGAFTNALDEGYLADITPTERRGTPRQLRLGLRWRTALRGSEAAGRVREGG